MLDHVDPTVIVVSVAIIAAMVFYLHRCKCNDRIDLAVREARRETAEGFKIGHAAGLEASRNASHRHKEATNAMEGKTASNAKDHG